MLLSVHYADKADSKLGHRSFPLPGDDLELVELQSEDAARVLDEGAHAQRARRRARVQRRRQVPHLKKDIERHCTTLVRISVQILKKMI